MKLAKLLSPTLVLTLLLTLAGAVRAQSVVHQGPSLQMQVQRGEARLPLSRVDRLRAGDRVMVRPDTGTLAKGDWVLLLARVSPRGNQIESRHFDVRELQGDAEIGITEDHQVPVVMLAPQLRNLFGLTTSLFDSGRVLNEVLKADPQRFYDLQNADQLNHAIRAISQGLGRKVTGQNPEQAIREASALAAKFGVRSLDPDCFKNQSVNTECVATSIVANRDFSLPSADDLSAMVGPRKSADLNSFLAANLRVLTDAADYLGNRYRDTYDFAPTFGRRQPGSDRIDLFSIARFRSGSVKTAYVYVPAWFTGTAPGLTPDRSRMDCHARARLDVQIAGRLPLVDYWHGWRMTVSDPGTREILADTDTMSFDSETGSFRFAPTAIDPARPPSGNQVVVRISGRFGFDPVELEPLRMALPLRDTGSATGALTGLDGMVSGERATLGFRMREAGACVREMTLALPGGAMLRSEAEVPANLVADLRQIASGPAELTIEQHGAEPIAIPVQVQPPRAKVTRIEHAEWEDAITVVGERLERIARIEVGRAICAPDVPQHPLRRGDGAPSSTVAVKPTPGEASLRFTCQGEVRAGTRSQETATVFHRGDAPGPIRVALTRTAARPSVELANDTPNALLATPSPKALRWDLSPVDPYMTEDSGLSLLLRARRPYTLARGSYQLQLRFRDDPQSSIQPLSAPLIADFARDELRTRGPVRFRHEDLPSVVNPLEYRVVHQPSGLASDWQALGRSVLMLPELRAAACAPTGDAIRVQGEHLDLIEGVRVDPSEAGDTREFAPARLVPCPSGLCLELPPDAQDDRVRLRVRWVGDRVFTVRLPAASPACAGASTAANADARGTTTGR